VKKEQMQEEGELLVGAMLRQEELDFIKAIGTMKLSPVLLQELRKAMAAAKKKMVLASTASPGGAVGAGPTSLDQPNVSKRKAEEIPSADCTDEPASRRPASCPEQPATRLCRGQAGICYSGNCGCQPAKAKWAAQVHSQRFSFR
jgi:hypothetical protein